MQTRLQFPDKVLLAIGALLFFIKEVPSIADGMAWLWDHSEWATQTARANATIRINSTAHTERWLSSEAYQPGEAGIFQTLDAMRALVRKAGSDPAVRDFALRLVVNCPGHGFDCEIKSCFEFARDRVTYRRDPLEVERVQSARRTLNEFETGDCDDKVVLLCGLLASIGHKSRFVIAGRGTDFTHVYCEALSSRGWISLDPTNEQARPGWQAPGSRRRETYAIF